MSIFGVIMKRLMSMPEYIEYLRNQGVKIGNDCEIYKSASFGSEPYFIEVGDHICINDGVKLVTHDGGVWGLRSSLSGYGKGYICALLDA